MLTLFLLLPAAGAGLIAVAGGRDGSRAKWIALVFSALAFAVSVLIFSRPEPGVDGSQFGDAVRWSRPSEYSLKSRRRRTASAWSSSAATPR